MAPDNAVMAGMLILLHYKLQTSIQSSLTVELTDGNQLLLSDSGSMVIDRTTTIAADSIIVLVVKGDLGCQLVAMLW